MCAGCMSRMSTTLHSFRLLRAPFRVSFAFSPISSPSTSPSLRSLRVNFWKRRFTTGLHVFSPTFSRPFMHSLSWEWTRRGRSGSSKFTRILDYRPSGILANVLVQLVTSVEQINRRVLASLKGRPSQDAQMYATSHDSPIFG